MKAKDFDGREPRLRLEEYFDGRTQAWGLFQDRFGTVRRQFSVTIDGRWDGETLTLDEDFLYDDGEREERVWRIEKTGEHTYEGSAEGVIGRARGEAYGNAFNWTYDFSLRIGGNHWRVHFDDWMFLQNDGVLINRASVSKFGVLLGEVTLFFRKEPEESERAAA
ncbi:MAG: DUF3833 domain-containing protein [Caulobacterales bacterium]|nr:DUF3833 domain-containing protein [Caulobacterales bacterium]